jgi:archaellum component FlaC
MSGPGPEPRRVLVGLAVAALVAVAASPQSTENRAEEASEARPSEAQAPSSLEALEARVTDIEATLAELRALVLEMGDPARQPPARADLGPLEGRVRRLEREVGAIAGGLSSRNLEYRLSTLENRVDSLQSQLRSLRTR